MVTAMYITNYWLTLHLNGKRVVVAPGAELPAGVADAEIRALIERGVIRQTPSVGSADSSPEGGAKPRKTKTEK